REAQGRRDDRRQRARRDHRRGRAVGPGGGQLLGRRFVTDLVVAGRGNLGRTLARVLDARLTPARSGLRLPRAGILFLAVPDGAVSEMATRIASMGPSPDLAVVHCSGSLGL